MIAQTLQFIRKKLSEDPSLNVSMQDIIADNLHILHNDTNKEGLFLSLVNIEEEGTMKNRPHHVRINNQLHRKEPPIVLNLYVLFAFRQSTYEKSITTLSQLITFFQENKWFTADQIMETTQFDPPVDKLIFELYNMNFEQLNHVWSVLGGSHYPSVLYKVRVVKLQGSGQQPAPEVSTITLESQLSL